MGAELPPHLAELARRGEWLRCLDILQQLVATRGSGAAQVVLQQPSLLWGVVQRQQKKPQVGLPDGKLSADRVSAVLVLCGQALRAVPRYHTITNVVSASPSTPAEERLDFGAAVCGTSSNLHHEGWDASSTPAAATAARTVPSVTAGPSSALSASQRQEWRRLVTSLLQFHVAAAADPHSAAVNRASALSSSSGAPSSASTPDHPETELSDAVAVVCTWAEAEGLDVDASLLSQARARADAGQQAVQGRPCKTVRDGDALSVGQGSGKHTTARRVAATPCRHGDTAPPSGGQGAPRASSPPRPDVPTHHVPASRVLQRLAAAWSASEEVAATPHRISCRSEADVDAGFRQAVSRVSTKDDVTAAVQYVVELHHAVCDRTRRCWRSGGSTSLSPLQHLRLFCALCEAVVHALRSLCLEGGVGGGTTAAAVHEVHQVALRGCIVVSAAELVVLELVDGETGTDVCDAASEGAVTTACLALCDFPDKALHATRAVRSLSEAVLEHYADATCDSPTGLLTTAPSLPAPPWHGSDLLCSAFTAVQREWGDLSGQRVGQEVFLLHLLVNTPVTRVETSDTRDNSAVRRYSIVSVGAAVRLAQRAICHCGDDTITTTSSTKTEVMRHLRRALLLPVVALPHLRRCHVASPARDGVTAARQARCCRFVCRVLDSCPAWLSNALLTGSLDKEQKKQDDTQLRVRRVLSSAEATHLSLAVQSLSCGLQDYHTDEYLLHTSSPDKVMSADDASPPAVLFLVRVLSQLNAASLLNVAQQLLSTDAPTHTRALPTAAPLTRCRVDMRGLPCSSCESLQRFLASIPEAETRGRVAEALLRGVVKKAAAVGVPAAAMADSYRTRRSSSARMTPDDVTNTVDAMGVLLESLLLNAVTPASTAAACMQSCLEGLTLLLERRSHTGTHDDDVCSAYAAVYYAVRQWFMSNPTCYLRHHAQLRTLRASRSDASPQPSVALTSAALQCAAWFHSQMSRLPVQTPFPSRNRQDSSPSAPAFAEEQEDHRQLQQQQQQQQQQQHERVKELKHLCAITATQIRRLCQAVVYHLEKEMTTAARTTLPASRSASASLAVGDASRVAEVQASCSAACNCVYDAVDVAHLCHLAMVSSQVPSALHSRAAASPVTTNALPDVHTPLSSSSSLGSKGASASATRPLMAVRLASPILSQDGPLNANQLHTGTPLSPTQHEQLVAALNEFSRHRRIREAVALFYAHERQNRRLTLSEMELFAEVAKRATAPFLVRLLLYVPPPCESVVLASAIVTGAWRSYQRTWRRYTQENKSAASTTAAAADASSHTSRVAASVRAPSSPADAARQLHRWNHQLAVEQSWFESMAIALRAMELLPSAPTPSTLPRAAPRRSSILSMLYRLVHAQPPWMPSSAHVKAMAAADEWNAAAVRTCMLTRALITCPSLRGRFVQDEVVRRSITEFQQTLDLCAAQHDAETAVRAYLRFVRTNALPQTTNQSPSSFNAAGLGAVGFPLLSLDSYVALLRLSATYVITSEEGLSGLAAHPTAAVTADDSMDGQQEPPQRPPPPPPPPAHAVIDDDSDMTQLCHLRVAMEAEVVGSAAPAWAAETSSGNHNEERRASATAATRCALASQRRADAFYANCAAALDAVAATLPRTLRLSAHGNPALAPLVTVLHDALRWCRLHPRAPWCASADDGSGDAQTALFDTSSTMAAAADIDAHDTAMAGADVLTSVLSSILHLAAAEFAVNAGEAKGRRFHSYSPSSRGGSAVAPVHATSALLRVFTCRLPRCNASWKLLQRSDVLLEYVLLYVGELHALERTTLWLSPLQQQQTDVAMVECLQVLQGVMNAVDLWAVEWKAQRLAKQGPATALSDTLRAPTPNSSEEPDELGTPNSAIDDLRVRLRGTPLRLLCKLLRDVEAGFTSSAATANSSARGFAAAEQQTFCQKFASALRDDVAAFEMCSPAHPAMRQLCGCFPHAMKMATGTRSVEHQAEGVGAPALTTSASGLTQELLRVCTSTHYAALTNFIADAVFARHGSGAAVSPPLRLPAASPAAPVSCRCVDSVSSGGGARLVYVLRCLTAGSVEAAVQSSQWACSNISGSAGGLIARIAAAEVTLRRLSVHLVDIRTELEAYRPFRHHEATRRSTAAPVLQLSRAATDFGQAALLLDEATAWWNVLQLESAVNTSSADVIGVGECNFTTAPADAVQWSSTRCSLLEQLRSEIARLCDVLMDLYSTVWWGTVLPTVNKVYRTDRIARFWTSKDVRFQHLYVTLFLQHQLSARAPSSKESLRGLVLIAEKLQQALVRFPCASAVAVEEAVPSHLRSAAIDMEALLKDDSTKLKDTDGVAWATCAVERALTEFLVQKSAAVDRTTATQHRNTAASSRRTAAVDMVVKKFRVAASRLPWQSAWLLWRVAPLILDDGRGAIEFGGVGEATEESYSSYADVTIRGPLCTLPAVLWELLGVLTGSTTNPAVHVADTEGSDRGAHDDGVTTTLTAGAEVKTVLSLALLSPAPLLVDGVLVHPLLRRPPHHQPMTGSPVAETSDCTWLKQLIASTMDEAASRVAEDDTFPESALGRHHHHHPAGVGDHNSLPDSYVAFVSAVDGDTTSTSPPTLLPVASLCQRVVPTLVLATLRDASLTPETTQGSTVTSTSREAVLLDLVHYLGYIAPQAWRTALQWIVGTPYPTMLQVADRDSCCATPSTSTAVAVTSSTFSQRVEVCTLRRLRAVFLACGPWPADVARPLLQHVLECQARMTARGLMDGGEGSEAESSVVFPEAQELLTLFTSPDEPHHGTFADRQGLLKTAGAVYHPLISLVLARLVDTATYRESPHLHPQGRSQESAKEHHKGPATYAACIATSPSLCLSTEGAMSPSPRFRVWLSTPSLPDIAPFPVRSSPTPPGTPAGASDGCRVLQDKPDSSCHPHVAVTSSLQLVADAAADPAWTAMSPAWKGRLLRLSTMPSLHACAQALQTQEWGDGVRSLHQRQLASTLRLTWKTLLLRRAPLHSTTRVREPHPISAADGDDDAWRRVCTAFLSLISSSAATRVTEKPFQARAKATMLRHVAGELEALVHEVCCFRVSSLLEQVLRSTLDNAHLRPTRRDDAWLAEGHVVAQLRALLSDDVEANHALPEALTSAVQARPPHAHSVRDDNAAPEARSLVMETPPGTLSADGMKEAYSLAPLSTPEQMQCALAALLTADATTSWSLWPPAAWEFWQARQRQREFPAEGPGAVVLRNPLLVVALMRAWKRGRGEPHGASSSPSHYGPVSRLDFYACCVVSLYPESSSAAPGSKEDDSGRCSDTQLLRPTTTQSTSVPASAAASSSSSAASLPATLHGPTRWSLMELWSCVDAYVHTGFLRLPCGASASRSVAFRTANLNALCITPAAVPLLGAVAGVSGVSLVVEAFFEVLSTEDARLRQQQEHRPAGASSSTTDDDAFGVKAVLRRLRPQLLGHGDATNPWGTYLPLPNRRGTATPSICSPSSTLSRDKGCSSPWHTLLHVLHLSTTGLLDRSAYRRGRRAAPSAAAMTCAMHKLAALVELQHEADSYWAASGVDTRGGGGRTPLSMLAFDDGQRVLCWQLRQLQRLQTHVSPLGWTVEQQQQRDVGQRCLQTSVSSVVALVKHGHSQRTGSGGRSRAAQRGMRFNPVEAATAACFYPHLELALTVGNAASVQRETTASVSCSATHVLSRHGEARQWEESGDVITTFADHPQRVPTARSGIWGATPRTAHCRRLDEVSASVLLKDVEQVVLRSSPEEANLVDGHDNNDDARQQSSREFSQQAQLQADYTLLHTFLSAVLGGVAQRQHDHDNDDSALLLLLRFLNSEEATGVLHDLGCAPESIHGSLRRLLAHLLRSLLASDASLALKEPASAMAVAGLRLTVALQPWLPVRPTSASAVIQQQHLTDATLVFALGALASTRQGDERVVRALISCVLDRLAHRRQVEALSSRGVALLGVLQQRLTHRKAPSTVPVVAQRHQTLSGAMAVTPVESDAVLWRVLHALSALDEPQAAAVHEAWCSYSPHHTLYHQGSRGGLTASNGAQQSNAKDGATWLRGFYLDSIEVALQGIHGGCSTVASTLLHDGWYVAAVRLRQWWATAATRGVWSAASRSVTQLHVMEDLLCRELLRRATVEKQAVNWISSGGKGGAEKATARRASHRVCQELLRKYTSLGRVVWGVAFHGNAGTAVPLLQLAVASALLRSPPLTPRDGLTDTDLAELLAVAVVTMSRGLCDDDLSHGAETNDVRPAAVAVAPLFMVCVNLQADVLCVATHALRSMRQQCRHARLGGAAVETLSSPLLRSWMGVMAPLRALLAAEALPEASRSMTLLSTAVGLQCRQPVRSSACGHLSHGPCFSHQLSTALYETMYCLTVTSHLLHTPLRVLLYELLVPLLVWESSEAAATQCSTSGAGGATRQANRLALLHEVAAQLAAHPALLQRSCHCRRSTSPASSSPLADAVEFASQTAITTGGVRAAVVAAATDSAGGKEALTDMHRGQASSAVAATDWSGWPAAVLLVKILARLEMTLLRRVVPATGGTPLTTSLPQSPSPPPSTRAADAFASRYAAALARRADTLEDYLVFALIASHYTSTEPCTDAARGPQGRPTGLTQAAEVTDAVDQHNSGLKSTQLHHAITAIAPLSSVSAVLGLFRHRAARTPVSSMAAAAASMASSSSSRSSLPSGSEESCANDGMRAATRVARKEERPERLVIPVFTEEEAQAVKLLSDLLIVR